MIRRGRGTLGSGTIRQQKRKKDEEKKRKRKDRFLAEISHEESSFRKEFSLSFPFLLFSFLDDLTAAEPFARRLFSGPE